MKLFCGFIAVSSYANGYNVFIRRIVEEGIGIMHGSVYRILADILVVRLSLCVAIGDLVVGIEFNQFVFIAFVLYTVLAIIRHGCLLEVNYSPDGCRQNRLA